MNNKFLALVEAGPTCEKYNNRAKLYLAMVFCYGCDPEEPLHFTAPLNTAFFNATKTAKICRSVADEIAPELFADCGFTLPDNRETICSPNSAVVPDVVWPDCDDGQYVCFTSDSGWYCSSEPCGDATPHGFFDVPCSTSQLTCGGALKLLNDNRAAKPPYYEQFPVEFVDEAECLRQQANASRCRCMRSPIAAAGERLLFGWQTRSVIGAACATQ
ncbi:hypothetical protein PINS_up006291 [Pythium insidiosum]|nr:hypothetical protein PINS_up006291 [Pythium insidiosum]